VLPLHCAVALPPSVLKVRVRAGVDVVVELDGRGACEDVWDADGFEVRGRAGFDV